MTEDEEVFHICAWMWEEEEEGEEKRKYWFCAIRVCLSCTWTVAVIVSTAAAPDATSPVLTVRNNQQYSWSDLSVNQLPDYGNLINSHLDQSSIVLSPANIYWLHLQAFTVYSFFGEKEIFN